MCLSFKKLIFTGRKKSREQPQTDKEVERRDSETSRLNFPTKDREKLRYSMLLTGYNKGLEFPRENLHIDFEDELATGVFTVFYKGKILNGGENTSSTDLPVAIKTLKPNAEILFFKALVRELKILSALSGHENVVSLMGACTANIDNRQLYIVVEYCEQGTLENYLRSHRSGFVNKFSPPKQIDDSIYENFSTVRSGALSTIDLLKWAIQVAKGMDFLSSNNLIHWELAARSVFLTKHLGCKLGDFHSLRKLQAGAEFFILKDKVPLPWKWMALESLRENKFSLKSDIWTYGVTLWEIFTLGEDPYVGSSFSEDFIYRLGHGGQRPFFPPYASSHLYELMGQCWHQNPEQRPRFMEIISMLEVTLSKLSVIPYS